MNACTPPAPSRSVPARILLAVVLALGCAAAAAAAAGDEASYTVQPGDHPWNIAQRYLLTPAHALRLARLNGIRNDRLIAPGTLLRIPLPWLRLQDTRARLARLHGEVQVLDAGGAARTAVEGEPWLPGTALRTGAQSTAQLEFDDGSHALVRQLSLVRLLQAQRPVLGEGRQLQLELVRGAVENLVRPVAGPGGRFEIRTPAAVAAVRGTQFRVSATERQTHTEVIDGEVLVRNEAGQTTTTAGNGTVADLGTGPGQAQRLLDAPDLSNLPARLERLPIDWPLPAVDGGTSYRTQLAADGRFDALLSDEDTTAPRVRVSSVADGHYVVRVRAVDARGLEGRSSERTVEVFAQPAPPFLIEPAPDGQAQAVRPLLRWTRAQAAWSYRVQVFPAQAPDTQPLDDQVVAGAAQTTAGVDLPPGLYRWRVAAIDPARQRQGPWGDGQMFRRIEPGPQVGAPAAQGDSLTLGWSAQSHAQKYRLQLSTDAAFGALLADAEVTSPRYPLPQPAPGTYHVRVQATGADGFTGPWGDVQTFTVPRPEPPPADWRRLLLLVPLLLLAL